MQLTEYSLNIFMSKLSIKIMLEAHENHAEYDLKVEELDLVRWKQFPAQQIIGVFTEIVIVKPEPGTLSCSRAFREV